MAKPAGLSARQLRILGELSQAGALGGFYLAGGTAVGWYFGHRTSADLDLFSARKDVDLSASAEQLTELGAKVRSDSDTMVSFDSRAGPVDLVRYPYPPLQRPKPGPGGFPVAAPLDLAVMKLAAISRRGLRRDFWDLYVLMARGHITLPALLKAYSRRYRSAASDEYHLVRALTYFDDAERDDPRLVGLSNTEWQRIKRWFSERATRQLKR